MTTIPAFFSFLPYPGPRLAAAFVFALLLSACHSGPPPEKITRSFWEAIAQGNTDVARYHATRVTQFLVTEQPKLNGAAVGTGPVDSGWDRASVETTLTVPATTTRKAKVLAFDTVLVDEDDRWKVDYLQTMNNFMHLPFGEIFKNLQGIGEDLGKDLQRQLPQMEDQLKSFSDELRDRLDDFRRELEKSGPSEDLRRNRTI